MNGRTVARIGAVVGALLFGCAAPQAKIEWAPEALVPTPPPSAYKDAPAVMLYRKVGLDLLFSRERNEQARVEDHYVVLLRQESQLDRSELKVRYPDKGRFLYAAARVTHPDGTVVEHDVAALAQTL